MTEEIINTDDYFYEITDEGRGTIGYGCVSYKTAELIRRIHKQNKQLSRLEQENKELKKQIESDKGLITVGGKQQYEYLQRVEELEQENKELKTKLDVFAFTISQYESALEEIKVISDNYNLTVNERRKQIADKINEVLNA